MNKSNGYISNKNCDLQNKIRKLWIEHVEWTRMFILSSAENRGDLDATTARLLRNPKDFADLLRPFYGDQIAAQFEKLLTDHLTIAAELVAAAKAGDSAKADEVRRRWYRNASQIAEFLSLINPYFDRKLWEKMMFDHLRMTENEASLILTGQFEESVEQYDMIENQAMEMADNMANGIMMQFRL